MVKEGKAYMYVPRARLHVMQHNTKVYWVK